MAQQCEVLITGVGVVSPIGIGKNAFWNSLLTGQSGIHRFAQFDPSRLPVPFGGEVRDFDGKAYVRPRKSLKVMCREIQQGFSAATLAMEDAGLEQGSVDPDRFGVVYGSEMLFSVPGEMHDAFRHSVRPEDGQFDYALWAEKGISRIYPLWMLMYLPNMVACHVAISFDARGPNNTITVGSASGLLALCEAADVIRRGQADVMVVGGIGNRINVTGMIHRSDQNLSHRHEAPEQACRPFDRDRDGAVNGEGAGAVILESREFASRRDVRPYAALAGMGRAYEAREEDRPFEGRAIAATLRRALKDAQLEPAAVSHVNAEGLSTVEDDRAEARAIRDVLGDAPVVALKSYFGNLGGATGVVELVGSLLALREQIVPATLNYERRDPECPVQVVAGQPLEAPQQVAAVTNHSSTGQAASVVLVKE